MSLALNVWLSPRGIVNELLLPLDNTSQTVPRPEGMMIIHICLSLPKAANQVEGWPQNKMAVVFRGLLAAEEVGLPLSCGIACLVPSWWHLASR